MSLYDFIFSDQLRTRISRHVLFWMAWSVYFIVTYFIPHHWFIDWQIGQPQRLLTEQLGYFKITSFFLINNFIGPIFNHILFTYPILYFLLPRYLFKSKYISFALGLVVLTILTNAIAYYKLLWYFDRLQVFYGIPAPPVTNSFLFYCSWTNMLFNCPTVAGVAAAIKIFKHYYLKEKEAAQLTKERTTAELELLKGQIHPHFLFNTMNNIYFFLITSSRKAPEMIKKLSGLLYYMMNECNQPLVALDQELKLITDYIALEKERYGQRLNMKVLIEGDSTNKMITPLLLIPFVENSFKHGASKVLAHPWINLYIKIEDEWLSFQLQNGKPMGVDTKSLHHGGIGFNNVKKRLQLLYPENDTLSVVEDVASFSVSMKVKLHNRVVNQGKMSASEIEYELA